MKCTIFQEDYKLVYRIADAEGTSEQILQAVM